MQFQAIKAGSARRRTACAIVGVHEGAALADAGRRLDRAAGGAISRLLRRGGLVGVRHGRRRGLTEGGGAEENASPGQVPRFGKTEGFPNLSEIAGARSRARPLVCDWA